MLLAVAYDRIPGLSLVLAPTLKDLTFIFLLIVAEAGVPSMVAVNPPCAAPRFLDG